VASKSSEVPGNAIGAGFIEGPIKRNRGGDQSDERNHRKRHHRRE